MNHQDFDSLPIEQKAAYMKEEKIEVCYRKQVDGKSYYVHLYEGFVIELCLDPTAAKGAQIQSISAYSLEGLAERLDGRLYDGLALGPADERASGPGTALE